MAGLKNPAPGEYNIRRAMIKKKPYAEKGPMSSFATSVV